MSDNLVPNNEEEIIESFKAHPAFVKGNPSQKSSSFSSLNVGERNLYNSTFSDLPDGNKDMITKNNFKFDDKKLSSIEEYFYRDILDKDGKTTLVKCKNKCRTMQVGDKKKYNPCSAFEFDKSTNECSLYNSIPNKFQVDNNFTSGYKNNYNFNPKDLGNKQQDNIKERIGSHFIQTKTNIINENSTHDLNKCMKLQKGRISVSAILQFNVRWNWSAGTNQLMYVHLSHNNRRVSDYVGLRYHDFPRGRAVKKKITFLMYGHKANQISIRVGNDALKLYSIYLYLNLAGNVSQFLMRISVPNRWIGEGSWWNRRKPKQTFGFPYTLDLNALKVSMDGSKDYIGTGKDDNKTSTFSGSSNLELDYILAKNNFQIEVNYIPKKEDRHWRNLFHYGNSNTERAPALWLFPNNSWKLHFRIRTTRSWNHGVDFYVPKEFRKWNSKINVRIEYIEYRYEDNNTRGFMLVASVNGKFVGSWAFYNTRFIRLNRRTFQIKDKWHQKKGYIVSDVKISNKPLIKLTTGRKRGSKENATKFNKLLEKLEPPFYIIRVGYNRLGSYHRHIVYKRLTSCQGVNMWDLFHNNWFSSARGVKNDMNKDFQLFSTLGDAIENKNAWKFCNYDDPGVGFPRDCGPYGGVGGQWQSKSRGGQIYWELYLFKAQGSYLNLNMDSAFVEKVKGFSADPYCAYTNLSNPKRIFNRNLTPVNSKTQNEDSKPDNDLILANMSKFDDNLENIDSLRTDLDNVIPNEKLKRKYLGDLQNVIKSNKAPTKKDADISDLLKTIGNSPVLENFDNKVKCNTQVCGVAIFLIVCLIIFFVLHSFGFF